MPAPFGAITLDRLRPSDLEALLLEKRAAGYSDSTIRLIYTVCRGVLEVAVRDGIIRRNIATLVKRPGVKHQDARYLTPMKWPSCCQLPKVIGCMPLSSSCSAPAFVAVRRSGCIGPTSTSRAGIIRARSELTRVNRQLIFDEELNSEASQGYVSLPAPVVEVLRHHKAAMAAERLAAPIWQPCKGHEDLVVYPPPLARLWSRVMCSGPSWE